LKRQPKKSLLTTTLVSFGLLFSSATIALASTTSFDVEVNIECNDEAASSSTIAPTYASGGVLTEGGVIQVNLAPTTSTFVEVDFDLNAIREADCNGITSTATPIEVNFLDGLAELDFISHTCSPDCSTDFNELSVWFSPMDFADFPADGVTYTGRIEIDLVTVS